MSESTEKHMFKPTPPKILAMTADQFDRLLADTKREAFEAACKVVCTGCAKGEPIEGLPKYFWHRGPNGNLEECDADKIRKLMEAKS